MNAGSITWAPVSPPAVVVLARSSDGCSWLSATRVTPATATRLAQAGHDLPPVSRSTQRRAPAGPVPDAVLRPPAPGTTGATSTGAVISEQHPGAQRQRQHHGGQGGQVEGGVGDHVHAQAPGAVRDERRG